MNRKTLDSRDLTPQPKAYRHHLVILISARAVTEARELLKPVKADWVAV